MHELSIATNIVEAAELEARRNGAVRVVCVRLTLGPLSGVVKEALESCFPLACEGSLLKGSRLEVDEAPIVIECPGCKQQQNAAGVYELVCVECGSPAAAVVSGRELEITALELEIAE